MPVTITVSSNVPKQWNSSRVDSSANLLKESCRGEHKKSIRITHSSFDEKLFSETPVSASTNGFVHTMLQAYSYHLHVTIRPEDVWFAVLVQISSFINAHAEELRSMFVAHEGSQKLGTVSGGSFIDSDVGYLAQMMTKRIQNKVVDPDLRKWFMPDFSTTTDSDRVVASVLMMGTMQKYFSYQMRMFCGIPSVTLLGEREDWEKILFRLDKLATLGDEPNQFSKLLRPILQRFINSFDTPEQPDPDVVSFWKKMVDKQPEGSGRTYIAGWMSAFCFWDAKGNIIRRSPRKGVTIDGVEYHRIDITDATVGFGSVPVKIDDNGHKFQVRMVAGSVGIKAGSSCGLAIDSIAPLCGWWVYETESQE